MESNEDLLEVSNSLLIQENVNSTQQFIHQMQQPLQGSRFQNELTDEDEEGKNSES